MAMLFNVTEADQFFLGEDKVLDFTIFNADGTACLNMAGVPLEWSMKKTDKATEALILKKTDDNSLITVGSFNTDPSLNTQRVRATFVPTDTNVLKPGTYRHSLKRLDANMNNILSYGDFTLLQATEH